MTMILRVAFRPMKLVIKLLIKLIAILWQTPWGKALLGIIVVLLTVLVLYPGIMWPLTLSVCLIGLTLIVVNIVQMTIRSNKLVPKQLYDFWQKIPAIVVLQKNKAN